MPEYRRLGDDGGGWPGTFDDVAAATDFVRDLARAEPAVDTSRVILAGHSAGGQLALWAASRRQRPGARPAGVVTLAAITDLAAYGAASGSCNASVTPLLGGRPSEVPERYRAVNPLDRLPVGVPIRLVHGDRDEIVPIDQSTTFAARGKAAGDDVNVTTITGAGHFDLIAPRTSAWPSVLAAFKGISPPR
jgi:acetyl esterase/lipase